MGALSLLGSGEFADWNEEVDRWLIRSSSAGTDRVLIIPTAAAPEGDDIFDKWARMGLEYFRRLGASPEVLTLKTKADADESRLVDSLDEAALVYFSGGNPAYLVRVLKGTDFWAKLVDGLFNGLSLAGCSAGINMLGGRAADSSASNRTSMWAEGMEHFPKVIFGPHWNRIEKYRPGLKDLMIASIPEGWILVGIDESTSMYGDGSAWKVNGAGKVTVYRGYDAEVMTTKEPFVLDLKSNGANGAIGV